MADKASSWSKLDGYSLHQRAVSPWVAGTKIGRKGNDAKVWTQERKEGWREKSDVKVIMFLLGCFRSLH